MSTANSDSELKSLTKHDEYYIATADLSVLVGHIQFRVHRYFFERESKWFRTKLITPASPGAQAQGSTDSNAIILDDLTPAEFARFLWVFYNPRYSLYHAEVEDWAIVLRLSYRWGFAEVKSLAIRELEEQDMLDVKRIKLYHDNDVDRNFLIPRYAALCEREAPLTTAEGMDLGMETALCIAAAREHARSKLAGGMRTPLTPTIHGTDLHEVIRDLFRIAPPTAAEAAQNLGALKTPPTSPRPNPPLKPTAPVQPQAPVVKKANQLAEIKIPTEPKKATGKGKKLTQQPMSTPTREAATTPVAPPPPTAEPEANPTTTSTTTTATTTPKTKTQDGPESHVVDQQKVEVKEASAPVASVVGNDSGAGEPSAPVVQPLVDPKKVPATPLVTTTAESRPDPDFFSTPPLASNTPTTKSSLFGLSWP